MFRPESRVIGRPDGIVLRGDNHDNFWDAPELGRQYRFYDAYYGNLGNCTITGGSGDRAALLVGNSYVGPFNGRWPHRIDR